MNGQSVAVEQAGRALLSGAQIAVRYLTIPGANWFGDGRSEHPRSGLDIIQDRIVQSPEAERYVSPLASFYVDVTIPFTRRRRLPVAALVELEAAQAPLVHIDIGSIETVWEGRTISLPPLSITAEMRDAVAFFESGHIVYAPAFVLAADRAGGPGTLPLSALTSLVGSSSAGYGQGLDDIRSRIAFRQPGEDAGIDLVQFVNRRMARLVDEHASGNVFADLVRPALVRAGWNERARSKARAAVSEMKWADFKSASIEVVGAERHPQVLATCRAAAAPSATLQIGPEGLALAALGQNVLDASNQDDREVLDSLSQAVVAGDEVLLIHPKLTVRFSSKARSFTEMRDHCGGCPYFMLTNMVLAYNEHLVRQSAKLVDGIQQALRHKGSAALSGAGGRDVREDLNARVQLFENQTLHGLPNIFRYPAERVMFDQIVRQRGLAQRSEGIERFTRALYELRKDFTDLAEREGTRRTNRLLMALGILQVSSLFLSGLGLDLDKVLPGGMSSGQVRIGLWALLALSLAGGFLVALSALRKP